MSSAISLVTSWRYCVQCYQSSNLLEMLCPVQSVHLEILCPMLSVLQSVGDTVSSAIRLVTSWRYCVQGYQSSNQLEILCPVLLVQQPVGDTVSSGISPVGDTVSSTISPVGDAVSSAISPATSWRYCVQCHQSWRCVQCYQSSNQLEILCPVLSV